MFGLLGDSQPFSFARIDPLPDALGVQTSGRSEADVQALKLAMNLSLGIGLVLFVVKVSAYLLTGSAAILSDAAESVVHVAAVFFAAYSLRVAHRSADQDHLFVHGSVHNATESPSFTKIRFPDTTGYAWVWPEATRYFASILNSAAFGSNTTNSPPGVSAINTVPASTIAPYP